MSRKGRDHSRKTMPDPVFGETLVTKFVNCMMWDGKRTVSERIFYGALDSIGNRYDTAGLEVFQQAMENVRPLVEVRSRRVGGATYQVPLKLGRSVETL